MSRSKLLAAAVISLLALVLRWRAMLMLPLDYDEPVYMEAAAQYAAALQAGDWPALLQNRHSIEHPALVKLLYAIATTGRETGPAALRAARSISVLFGVLQVALLALLSPVAGFFLAIHTMAIKYTSQAYLEALPAFASLLAVVAYERSLRKPALNRWFIVSAIALGATAASKYTYLVVALVIVPLLIWRNLRRPWIATLYCSIALLTFLLLDVELWADPLGRLWQSLSFHPAYAQSSYVQSTSLRWYQQLYYLSRSVPWHPGVFPLPWDTLTFVLGVLGIPVLCRRRPIYALWFALGMVGLLLWPTRWPQYTLIVLGPLCLSGGTLLTACLEWLDQRTGIVRALRPFVPDRATSLFLAFIALGFLAVATYVQLQYSEQMKGWTYYTTRSSSLPSDSVRALAIDQEGRVWAGTEAGLARFADGNWTTYNVANSGLADNLIRALAVDHDGRVWVGTENGVSVLQGETWSSYTIANSGLLDDHVLCIAPLPAELDTRPGSGPVWFGTEHGASYFDGTTWTNYTAENSGLAGSRVLSIAIDAQGRTWFGTWGGLSVFDGQSWTSYTSANSGLVYDTVPSVVINGDGRIWCGTLDGISVFDGLAWRTYSMTNMALRFNTATVLAIDHRGQIWVGGDLPTGPIGTAAMFDGEQWHDYSQYFSGDQRAPVRAITADPEGRIWFGTLLAGVVVYDGFIGQE
jgi:sugar lactone lactonase YvrE